MNSCISTTSHPSLLQFIQAGAGSHVQPGTEVNTSLKLINFKYLQSQIQ